jgi:glycosyltransferase involved in cell wall biosynthesis
MRILFLSDINSAHTRKWALSLAQRGHQIGIFSLSSLEEDWLSAESGIENLSESGIPREQLRGSGLKKVTYLKRLTSVKRAIFQFKPDILHAHYATSYGLLGALSGCHPYIISVWGSDVFNFPRSSWINKQILRFNFRKADVIMSTSEIMKNEIQIYTNKPVEVTPFGVDTVLFHPAPSKTNGVKRVGIIKSLEDKYGIDVLIRAFSLVKQRYNAPVELYIAGRGSREAEYRGLVRKMGLDGSVHFGGYIPQAEVPELHRTFDVFVTLSVEDSESFGVSLVESMASGVPSVVSQVGGLQEVAEHEVTSYIIRPRDEMAAAEAILSLLRDETRAKEMGRNARERVIKHYDWKRNLDHIEEIYKRTLLHFS